MDQQLHLACYGETKYTGADSFGGASGCIEAIADFIEEAVCALHRGVKWHNDIVERNGGAR